VRLSPREKEVVCLIPHTNLQIAWFLGIAKGTVKNHIRMAGIKMGVTGRITRTRVLLAALESGEIAWQDVAVGDRRLNDSSRLSDL